MPAPDDDRFLSALRDYLRRAAFAYLERYASSSANLARVLERKARRRIERSSLDEPPDPAAVADLVARTVADVLELGLVDDKAFAEMKVASGRRKGLSRSALGARLAAKGVDRETAAAAIDAAETDDDRAALLFARRKRLGPFRTREPADARDADRRDVAALCRGGFAYPLARRVIALDREAAEAALEGDAHD